jgi:small subunit ribosomal protein S4
MAHYIGPKHKLARKQGVNVIDKQSASLQRRLTVAPGMHGAKRKRKLSEFGLQLKEKQKAKTIYGVQERQFKSLVQFLRKQKGDTGELIIAALETRLDNLVYRLGFAKSRFMARQMVSHGHILVNGKKVTIPSYHVEVDSILSLHGKMTQNVQVAKLLESDPVVLPFLERQAGAGKLVRMPKREDIDVPFNTQMIVEYYSR